MSSLKLCVILVGLANLFIPSNSLAHVQRIENEKLCPCVEKESCPKIYGKGAMDIREMGFMPACQDFGTIRCCGVSIRIEQENQSKRVSRSSIDIKSKIVDHMRRGTNRILTKSQDNLDTDKKTSALLNVRRRIPNKTRAKAFHPSIQDDTISTRSKLYSAPNNPEIQTNTNILKLRRPAGGTTAESTFTSALQRGTDLVSGRNKIASPTSGARVPVGDATTSTSPETLQINEKFPPVVIYQPKTKSIPKIRPFSRKATPTFAEDTINESRTETGEEVNQFNEESTMVIKKTELQNNRATDLLSQISMTTTMSPHAGFNTYETVGPISEDSTTLIPEPLVGKTKRIKYVRKIVRTKPRMESGMTLADDLATHHDVTSTSPEPEPEPEPFVIEILPRPSATEMSFSVSSDISDGNNQSPVLIYSSPSRGQSLYSNSNVKPMIVTPTPFRSQPTQKSEKDDQNVMKSGNVQRRAPEQFIRSRGKAVVEAQTNIRDILKETEVQRNGNYEIVFDKNEGDRHIINPLSEDNLANHKDSGHDEEVAVQESRNQNERRPWRSEPDFEDEIVSMGRPNPREMVRTNSPHDIVSMERPDEPSKVRTNSPHEMVSMERPDEPERAKGHSDAVRKFVVTPVAIPIHIGSNINLKTTTTSEVNSRPAGYRRIKNKPLLLQQSSGIESKAAQAETPYDHYQTQTESPYSYQQAETKTGEQSSLVKSSRTRTVINIGNGEVRTKPDSIVSDHLETPYSDHKFKADTPYSYQEVQSEAKERTQAKLPRMQTTINIGDTRTHQDAITSDNHETTYSDHRHKVETETNTPYSHHPVQTESNERTLLRKQPRAESVINIGNTRVPVKTIEDSTVRNDNQETPYSNHERNAQNNEETPLKKTREQASPRPRTVISFGNTGVPTKTIQEPIESINDNEESPAKSQTQEVPYSSQRGQTKNRGRTSPAKLPRTQAVSNIGNAGVNPRTKQESKISDNQEIPYSHPQTQTKTRDRASLSTQPRTRTVINIGNGGVSTKTSQESVKSRNQETPYSQHTYETQTETPHSNPQTETSTRERTVSPKPPRTQTVINIGNGGVSTKTTQESEREPLSLPQINIGTGDNVKTNQETASDNRNSRLMKSPETLINSDLPSELEETGQYEHREYIRPTQTRFRPDMLRMPDRNTPEISSESIEKQPPKQVNPWTTPKLTNVINITGERQQFEIQEPRNEPGRYSTEEHDHHHSMTQRVLSRLQDTLRTSKSTKLNLEDLQWLAHVVEAQEKEQGSQRSVN